MSGVPDYAEPVLGFRAWSIDREGRLGPVTGGASWKAGINEAECFALRPGTPKHKPPKRGCGCGFNAFHRIGRTDLHDNRMPWVVGAIGAWGEIDVYRDGFRAEYASVIALSYEGSTTIEDYRRLQRAGELYGVKLVELAALEAEAERYARPMPADALPREAAPIPPKKAAPAPGAAPAAPKRVRTRQKRKAPPVAPGQMKAPGLSAPARVRGPAPHREIPADIRNPWESGETGYRLSSHLAITVRGDMATLNLTAAFLAVLGEPRSITFTAPGSRSEEGDVVAVIESEHGHFAVRSPFAGELAAINDAAGTGSAKGLTKASWIARLRTTPADIAGASAIWGEEAWNSYRRYVSARDDATIRAELALEPGAAAVRIDDGRPDLTSRGGVRWLARVLDPQLEADTALQSALAEREIELGFWVPDLGCGVMVRMQRPDRPAITFCDIEPDCALALSLDPEALQAYWTGELDLAAALGGRVGLTGSRDEALRATALLRRLFGPHLARVEEIRAAGRTASRSLRGQGRRAA